jgi:NADPH-dependent 2,4-dienoyl-CoA reductase/sulfur reductase-like enzyme
LRARELDPSVDVTLVVADAFPNFSICGIPYYVSGEVTHWRNLAHRTADDLAAAGLNVRSDTLATRIDTAAKQVQISGPGAEPVNLFEARCCRYY